jgi:hypothetical protein
MTNFTRYWPAGVFEDKDGVVVPVKDVSVVLIAATANQAVIAAVSGKEIRILSGCIVSAGAVTSALFKSASGGTTKTAYIVPPNTAAAVSGNVILEPNLFGWFRTTAGEGLFCDTGAVGVRVSLNYIEV